MKKVTLFVLILLFLTACGEKSAQEDSDSTKENAADLRTVTIEDGIQEVKIEGTPKKVVVLEWTYVEHLLPLGIQPIGVSDVEGYNKWINVGDPLSESVKDVGTRAEPNLEAISRLNPDLIIGVKYRHEGIIKQLQDIAPTVMFAPYSQEGAKNQYQHMLDEFHTIAKIFDKQAKADEVEQQLEKTFKEQGQRIADAGYKNLDAVVTQAFTSQNAPVLRLFTDNSVVAGVLEKMGVNNAVTSDKPEIYGFLSVSVEALQNYQDNHFFYLVQEDDTIFSEQLADNPAWTNLNFVKENHTYKLPGDMGTFAGPLSAKRLSVEFADALVNNK
ncbi:iron-siderophore ABC transporter substrate-binding protein [Virgibacillus necropolis]|uniref:ABC transporter substrate-binding protein n=1 Tax=Virgibacillus necropolis TaxID=163877 RepID=UPI00384F895C